jgi:hypothetical protein
MLSKSPGGFHGQSTLRTSAQEDSDITIIFKSFENLENSCCNASNRYEATLPADVLYHPGLLPWTILPHTSPCHVHSQSSQYSGILAWSSSPSVLLLPHRFCDLFCPPAGTTSSAHRQHLPFQAFAYRIKQGMGAGAGNMGRRCSIFMHIHNHLHGYKDLTGPLNLGKPPFLFPM